MTFAEVKLWGARVGAVAWNDESRSASFEYDAAFRARGVEVSPVTMPLDTRIYQFPELPDDAFRGLPGLLADSLPDRYGNALIDAWLARQGRDLDSFNPVERLCYIGTRGMGALEYHPPQRRDASRRDIDVAALVELADAVLAERTSLDADLDRDALAINQILQVGTSAGGARAKAIIAWNPATESIRSGQAGLEPGFSHWILKLDGVRSIAEREVGAGLSYGLVEYAYALMAVRAGVQMTECRVLAEGGRHHFMTRRFDRTDAGEKVHMQSLAGMAHYDFNQAGAYAYEQAVSVMRQLQLSQSEIEQLYRRAVFNVIARNQDDHVKNIAFLMNDAGRWSLSPAFDVTYSYNPAGTWTSRHQMTLSGKRDAFTLDDLLAFARYCNLKQAHAQHVIDDVISAVRDWPQISSEAGLPSATARAIERHLRLALT